LVDPFFEWTRKCYRWWNIKEYSQFSKNACFLSGKWEQSDTWFLSEICINIQIKDRRIWASIITHMKTHILQIKLTKHVHTFWYIFVQYPFVDPFSWTLTSWMKICWKWIFDGINRCLMDSWEPMDGSTFLTFLTHVLDLQ
jgi:hypothetical protein